MPRWCGVVDRDGHRRHQPGGASRVGDVVLQSLVEALPGDQLHAEIVLVLELADLEDRHDVGVVEPGDGLGLVLEPADLVGGGEPGGLDHLQSHRAVEAELPGLVDDPHAPFAQDALQLVVAEVADAGPGRETRAGRTVQRGGVRCVGEPGGGVRGRRIEGWLISASHLGLGPARSCPSQGRCFRPGLSVPEPVEETVRRHLGHEAAAIGAVFQVLVDRLGRVVVELAQAIGLQSLRGRMRRI